PDNNHEGLVIYSMGNIISNQREEAMGFSESENGIIPIIDIKKDESGDTYIDNIQYIPTWVNKFRDANNNVNYEIVPLNEDLEVASTKYNASINDLTKSLENTMNVIGENIAIYKGN
ncbi:MAG: hypothetical protein IJH34_06130, partial [Romboutsia sp.]|nr:hypothetical protein [Romboutsia sp.]